MFLQIFKVLQTDEPIHKSGSVSDNITFVPL